MDDDDDADGSQIDDVPWSGVHMVCRRAMSCQFVPCHDVPVDAMRCHGHVAWRCDAQGACVVCHVCMVHSRCGVMRVQHMRCDNEASSRRQVLLSVR